MARPLRIEICDGVYHVTSRGLERRRIVRDDDDRQRWTELLDVVAARRQWRVLAWALMDNHFHIFLRTPHGDLSAGMHDLNSGYATGFNRRRRRSGPLFQGRFKGILVEKDYHYWELRRRTGIDGVKEAVSEALGVPKERFCVRRKQHNEERQTAIYLCRKWTVEGIREIGEAFGGVSGQAISRTASQVSNRLASERRLRDLVGACEAVLMDKLEIKT